MQGRLLLGDPVFYALAGALLEGEAEGAVAAVTAAGGQMLGLDGLALRMECAEGLSINQ